MMHDTRSSRVEELEIQAQTYYMEVCGGWAGDGVGWEMGLGGRWGLVCIVVNLAVLRRYVGARVPVWVVWGSRGGGG